MILLHLTDAIVQTVIKDWLSRGFFVQTNLITIGYVS